MGLDVSERRTYVRLLGQRIETENQAFETLTERLRRG
jgi:hypothetical protein